MISVKDSVQTLKILKTVQLINNLGQMDEEFFVKDNPVLQRTCCRRAFFAGSISFCWFHHRPGKKLIF